MQVPTARGSNLVPTSGSGFWDVKMVGKSSIHGDIYIGIETIESIGKEHYIIGQDWFNEICVGRTFYYCTDGDCCSGNIILSHTCPYKIDDVIGLQLENETLTFTKNGKTVSVITALKGFARVAIQMHRPGDKLYLLREFVGPAAAEKISEFKAAELQREEDLRKKYEEEEMARQFEREIQRLKDEEEMMALALIEEERRRVQAQLDAQRLRAEEDAARRSAEEAERKKQLDQERAAQMAERRTRLAKEEAARKKAAQLQIQKVARARGFCQETPDADAPTDVEIRDFLRDCLPLRLVAARQRGRAVLPALEDVAKMELILTPQQYHAVRSHLTALNKAIRSSGLSEASAPATDASDFK